MAIGEKFVLIRVDLETGEVDFPATTGVAQDEIRASGVQSVKDEIEEIKRGKKRYLRVGEIIQTVSSPGCVYWDGIRWIKFC
jgi:hypothetical protein